MMPSQHRIQLRGAQQILAFLLPLSLLSVLIFMALPLRAQETAPAISDIRISPSQVTIAAQRGAVESRQFLLQSDGPIAQLDFFAQDLTSADGASVLPARAIDMILPLTGSLASPMTMDLVVDLGKAASGAYSGDALLTYDDNDQWINLRVSVKDPPWIPLAVLLAGVVLGVGLNYYRQRIAPRDAKLVEMDDLILEVDSDPDLRPTGRGAAFRQRIDLYVADAAASVRGGAWSDAEQYLERARKVHAVWRREREGWRKVLERQASLLKELSEGERTRGDASAYLADLRSAAGEVVEQTVEEALAAAQPAGETPASFAPRLDGALKRIHDLLLIYLNESAEIENGRQRLQGLSGDAVDAARSQLEQLEGELRSLRPWSDANALSRLSDLNVRIKRAGLEVRAAADQAADGAAPEPAAAPMPLNAPSVLAAWPALDLIATPVEVQHARSRRALFQYASFLVAVALLAGAGFQELYLSNPTFGSNLWTEYFALLAWGFGAEATRASVTELIRGWESPASRAGAAGAS